MISSKGLEIKKTKEKHESLKVQKKSLLVLCEKGWKKNYDWLLKSLCSWEFLSDTASVCVCVGVCVCERKRDIKRERVRWQVLS